MARLPTGTIVRFQQPTNRRPNSVGRIMGYTAKGLAIVQPLRGCHKNEIQKLSPDRVWLWKKILKQDRHAVH